ncbi:MAG: DUF1152 domain-containing protein [Pseudonocardia sp.]
MPPLIAASGGCGDAITAAALSASLDMTKPPVVMTYSWDRLMIDPVPGPRRPAEFTGLIQLAPGLVEVVASSAAIPPAGSALPRLAAELPARLLLLDPSRGAIGLSEQIAAAATVLHLTELVVVDVGGDALTVGARDPGLRSPLADQLVLAACARTGLATRLLITGAGLDGELPAPVVRDRLGHLHATPLRPLGAADAARIAHVFGWHPSEASGLLAAAAAGIRGVVEVRDAGDQVPLDDTTTTMAAVDAARAIKHTPAAHLTGTRTLTEAEHIIHELTGISEIAYEHRKAAALSRRDARRPTPADLDLIDRAAAAAHERGAAYVSIRRLAELVHATTLPTYAALSDLLAHRRPDRYRHSLYRTG